jgi:hypothetical protein
VSASICFCPSHCLQVSCGLLNVHMATQQQHYTRRQGRGHHHISEERWRLETEVFLKPHPLLPPRASSLCATTGDPRELKKYT